MGATELIERKDVCFLGNGIKSTAEIFGGHLRAWCDPTVSDGKAWFERFRQESIDSIGKRFLPIYRMADGEFQFLVGRRFNSRRKPRYRELISQLASCVGFRRNGATIWGEHYKYFEVQRLREDLLEHIRSIASAGYLAMFLYENGLEAFCEYNAPILKKLESHGTVINSSNYVPFHFPLHLLVSKGWQEFFERKKVLVSSGLSNDQKVAIKRNIFAFGAKGIEFLDVSKGRALTDVLDLSKVAEHPDIILVASGIGAANVLNQLRVFDTLAMDIGSYIRCLSDEIDNCHGGVFQIPNPK